MHRSMDMMRQSSFPSESSEGEVKVKTRTFTRTIDAHASVYHQLVNVVKVLSTQWLKREGLVGVGTWVHLQRGQKAIIELAVPSLPSPKVSSSLWSKE